MDSFRLNVAGYIIKPVDYHKFVEAIQTIDLYWTLSELPNENIEDTETGEACVTSASDEA